MAKDKIMYVCEECGHESAKWVGRCPNCGLWNTMKEFKVSPSSRSPRGGESLPSYIKGMLEGASPQRLGDIKADAEVRIDMGDGELNRVLGGGLVKGSLVLLGGEPGIGKSTLILQTVLRLPDKKILYVSGEESARQIKLRADRLNTLPLREGQGGSSLLILCETSLEAIYEHIEAEQPDIVVIDREASAKYVNVRHLY